MFSTKNDELTKQIIELSKNHEELKIEKLLEEKLKLDPENIDLLFRLATLNFCIPIVDYPSCYLLLEKIISISKKHATIAKLIISCIKDRESGFIDKRVISWFYEGKDSYIINPLIKQLINPIIEHGICKNIQQEIIIFLENKLKNDPHNIEALLLLVIIGTNTPKSNPNANIKLLEKIINISKENEAIATILFAYIRDFSYIDEDLLNRLNSLNTDNPEINSMIKYAISWFYAENTNYNNPILEEKYLKESVDSYQGHAWNYVHLARLYNKQGRNAESEQLMQKAQANVKNEPENQDYDPTNLNDFLNERIKGTSSDNVKL